MNVHSGRDMTAQTTTTSAPSTEDRSNEILASIRQAFADKGFDGASMQDLARAAGMSVGNFYRYFPSKAAIVVAMVGLDLDEIEADFAQILVSPDPMSALKDKIVARMTEDCTNDGQLWAEITAAAIRKPKIAAASAQMEEMIIEKFARVFARVTGRSLDEARSLYRAQSELLVMLVKAVSMRSSQCGPAGADLTRLVLRIIDQTLSEISSDTSKG